MYKCKLCECESSVYIWLQPCYALRYFKCYMTREQTFNRTDLYCMHIKWNAEETKEKFRKQEKSRQTFKVVSFHWIVWFCVTLSPNSTRAISLPLFVLFIGSRALWFRVFYLCGHWICIYRTCATFQLFSLSCETLTRVSRPIYLTYCFFSLVLFELTEQRRRCNVYSSVSLFCRTLDVCTHTRTHRPIHHWNTESSARIRVSENEKLKASKHLHTCSFIVSICVAVQTTVANLKE